MSEKFSGSKFPEDINQNKLDKLLNEADIFWHGIKERSDLIENDLNEAQRENKEIDTMKEIKDILKDEKSLDASLEKLNVEYYKMLIRLQENKQDILAEAYVRKFNQKRRNINKETVNLAKLANRFRDVELNKIFRVEDNKQRKEEILRFTNKELDKARKEFVKNAEDVEVSIRIYIFEEAIMDSLLNIGGNRSLQALDRLESLENITYHPFDDSEIFHYLEVIFRQLIKMRDIPNAEKVLIKINRKESLFNLKVQSKYDYELMLERAKSNEAYGNNN